MRSSEPIRFLRLAERGRVAACGCRLGVDAGDLRRLLASSTAVRSAENRGGALAVLGAFFRRLAKRKPRHVSLMALARKLVTVAYLMLKHSEPYRYARPELMAKKFTELRDK